MNQFLQSIDNLFDEYNNLIRKKTNTTVNLQKVYEDFKNQKILKKETKSTSNGMLLQNKEKKKKTAYQNFFTITRAKLTDENQKIPFGELSKMISSKWKEMSALEKKKYVSKVEETESNNNLEEFFIQDEENLSEEENSEMSEMNLPSEKEFSEEDSDLDNDEDSISFNFEED